MGAAEAEAGGVLSQGGVADGAAFEQYGDGLVLRHELGDAAGLAECFDGLALDLGRCEDAVVMLAAARGRRSASAVAAPAAFSAALATGTALTVAEVVDRASAAVTSFVRS